MRKSFLNANAPFITEMIQTKTAKQAEHKIRNAIADGATAIGLQLQMLPDEERTQEKLTALFEAAENRPVYITNYREDFNKERSDDELMEGLLLALQCGATLVDVMGDMFNPSFEELTTDEKAIKKQMEFIDEVHKRGGEVLMSSHIYHLCSTKKVFEFRSAEKVLEIALEQQRRGADIVKIVTGADTQEEELKNLEICHLLKKELKVPFLFLSGGKYTYLHRTIGPALGVSMWLCFREYDESTYVGPPLLSNVLKIKHGLKL
ncbi:MAG: type I 3-dehydroquinate dehydratase [Clostridia bacterium]|nr:type I 3-dehydroquinate dehydratase [Clostridia bacterium]